ncbi:hypothetical protein PIB30_080582, partial [Stylosanthes scabra]|nr:hypothetical protein [Stylosanthes scabra]
VRQGGLGWDRQAFRWDDDAIDEGVDAMQCNNDTTMITNGDEVVVMVTEEEND